MDISYSDHAKRRMKQRGITELEVEMVLEHPIYLKKSFEGRLEICGRVNQRTIKVVFVEIEKYKRIITVM